MTSNGQLNAERARVRILVGLMAFALLVLVVALYRLQVMQVAEHSSRLERQSIRRVRLPGPRGRVYDRNGVVLCDNKPSYCIAVYVEELRIPGKRFDSVDALDKLIDRLSSLLGLARTVTLEEIKKHVERRRPLSLIAWHGVSESVVARLMAFPEPIPGVDIEVHPSRYYPHGQTAAHVLGYVGRARQFDDKLEDRPFDFFLTEQVGRSGIEKRFEDELTGVPGGALIRVDAFGFKHKEEIGKKPVAGNDVRLTIDVDIQKVVEEVLGGRRGAGVVIDPRNGEVLAMASSPTYDLNMFTPRINSADWSRLSGNPDYPLINRCISATYPPGSIFKPVVAITALQNRVVTPADVYNCPGYFMLGKAKIRCWRSIGHGLIAMRKSLEQSCNSYYCQLGLACKYDKIYHMASAFGLGRRCGIDLGGESSGLLPTREWKKRKEKKGWYPGDTCNISIGQGFLLATPLQMAVMAAAIANGGKVYRPRLILDPGRAGSLVKNMNLYDQTVEVVRGGMRDVIQSSTGTGRSARIFGVDMGGKTGTAQYKEDGVWKKHAWMIVFAPFDNPRYAVAMIIEDGQGGGGTVGFRIKRVMETIFQLEGIRGGGAGV